MITSAVQEGAPPDASTKGDSVELAVVRSLANSTRSGQHDLAISGPHEGLFYFR
jgi:hypothetical protein